MNDLDMDRYRRDAKGNLVAVENIREIDLLRDELVNEIVGRAQAVQSSNAGRWTISQRLYS